MSLPNPYASPSEAVAETFRDPFWRQAWAKLTEVINGMVKKAGDTANGVIRFAVGIVVSGKSGDGVKVDAATPTWGWRDIIGQIEVRSGGGPAPTLTNYNATGIYQYKFSGAADNEVYCMYHVPHDYVPGTDIYFHMHWSNDAATPSTNTVRWGFTYTWAKGFNQMAFGAATTVYVNQACPATSCQHNIAETAACTLSGLEVDSIILVKVFRNATDAADNNLDAVFGHTCDIHYQSTNLATKNKAPNFYSTT